MTVLLTGGGGAIGCHTIAHIMHNTDWDLVVIDSFRHKGLTDRIVRVCRNHPDWLPRIRVYTHDLTAPLSEGLMKQIGPVDYIINMASDSHVDRSIEDPVRFIKNNVDLVLNMLEYARKVEPKVFVQISTDEVYGPSGVNDGHPEWSSIVPSNPYSASKASQEAIAISYWRTYGVPVVITNTMNNFAEMQDPEKYPAMVQRKVLSGETVTVHGTNEEIGSRYYLHSRNHADAVLWIISNTTPHLHEKGQIDRPDRYNIVGEQRIDNLELAKTIAELMGKPLNYKLVDFHSTRPGHDMHYGLDGSKIKKLGWSAPIGLKESLKNTIEWTMRNREWL